MTTASLGDQPSECVRHRRRDGRDTLTGWHTQRSARLPIDVSTASGFEVLANDRFLFVSGIVSRYPGDQLPVIPRQLQLCGAGLLRCGLLAAARRRLQLFFFGWTDERRQRLVDAEAVLVEVSEDGGTSRTTEGLAGAFESGVGGVEQPPERGCPCVGVGFENSELFGVRHAVDSGLGIVLEHSKIGRCRDDKSPAS